MGRSLMGFVLVLLGHVTATTPFRAALLTSLVEDTGPGEGSGDASEALQAAVAEIAGMEAAKYKTSMAISVYSESRGIQATAAAGTVSQEPRAPNTTTQDQFVWGSITKISTGSAILQLDQTGKLSLDDTIPQYVDPMLAKMKAKDPALNFSSCVDIWGAQVKQVTIRHLATMNSGIPDFDTAKPFPPPPKDALRATIYSTPAHDFTPPELLSVPWVAKGYLEFTPGHAKHGFAYSSTNFILLGLILAHHAGAPGWEEFDQTTFLPSEVKAKLPSVRYVRSGAPSDVTRIHGYDRTSYNGQQPTALPGIDAFDTHGVFAGWSASDYTSTVADAAVLAYEVYGPQQRIIDASHQKIMIPACPGESFCIYGFATFNLTDQTGKSPTLDRRYDTAYGHIGATYGYDSMLSYHPELDLTIAIASGMENDDQTHPSDSLCEMYGAVKRILTPSEERCSYKPKGYYGGECTCT